VTSCELKQVVNDLLREGFARMSLSEESASSLSEVFESARLFFQDREAKTNGNTLPEGLGYRPGGIEYSQSPERPDRIESFSVSARTSSECAVSLSVPARALYDRMMMAVRVLEPIADSLIQALIDEIAAQPSRHRLQGALHRWSILQVNYSRLVQSEGLVIQDLHEDGTLLTLACATGPGLAVQIKSGPLVSATTILPEMIVMPGEIAYLLSGGAVAPLYHRVHSLTDARERLSLLFFADIDPAMCEPWVRNRINDGVAIGERVVTNPSRFGLEGFHSS
jgi:isopenicillin N synthase-like dioxygenase